MDPSVSAALTIHRSKRARGLACWASVLLLSLLPVVGVALARTGHGTRAHEGTRRHKSERRHNCSQRHRRTRHHHCTRRHRGASPPKGTNRPPPSPGVATTPAPQTPLTSASPVVGAPAAASPAGPLTVGFNDTAGPTSYPLQAELGVAVRRMLVGWNQVQTAPGSWDWSHTDVEYAAVLAAGLRPLLVALAPPCWAHPSDPCGSVDLGVTPPDPDYDSAWSGFVGRLAARYPAAVGIEIWNEENLGQGFLPAPSPTRYTQLLQEAYVAVKGVDPSMPVISGGLFVSPVSGPGGIGDAQFLEGMYAAGAKGYMDGIGIHIYPTAGTTAGDVGEMENDLNALRAVRDAAGDSARPIWITEAGVSTASETDAEQADDLVSLVQQAAQDADVPVAILHRLIDPAATGSGSSQYAGLEPGYGVFGSDGTPKPAACALSALLHGSLSC